MQTDIYETSKKAKNWMGNRYKRRTKDCENKQLDKTHPGPSYVEGSI